MLDSICILIYDYNHIVKSMKSGFEFLDVESIKI
jgi:hypothetical protein